MKGSAVVQGLKSLASKLHPQLPLSPKESQRLLTALTSSFRKQLDQAHSEQINDEEGKLRSSNESISKTGKQQLHSSSAALADRHLASILTSPLLAKDGATKKPALDYASAKIELQKNPAKDPISLLEEYHEKGAATIPIAVLCLESFKEQLELLPEHKRQEEILKTQAGKRALLWLWNSGLYETDAFVDDFRFIGLMVPFVMKEDSEKYLWEWFQMDLTLGNQTHPGRPNVPERDAKYRYRWKGRLLRNMITTRLRETNDLSANSALDTFFKALAMKSSAITRTNPDPPEYPLYQASMVLCHDLFRIPKCSANTDPARFDKLVESVDLWLNDDHGSSFKPFQIAILRLSHPRTPSPFPALKCLRGLFDPPAYRDRMYMRFTKPKDEKQMKFHYSFLVRAAAMLQDHAHTEDANWVISVARQLFPKLASSLETHIRQDRRAAHVRTPTNDESHVVSKEAAFPFSTWGPSNAL